MWSTGAAPTSGAPPSNGAGGRAPRRTTSSSTLTRLWDALLRLPYRQRAALVLRYYQDATEADIAAALDVRPATVRSLVHRGLAKLRKEVPA